MKLFGKGKGRFSFPPKHPHPPSTRLALPKGFFPLCYPPPAHRHTTVDAFARARSSPTPRASAHDRQSIDARPAGRRIPATHAHTLRLAAIGAEQGMYRQTAQIEGMPSMPRLRDIHSPIGGLQRLCHCRSEGWG